MQALASLSPTSQQIVVTLVKQLAQKEGYTVPDSGAVGLRSPADGISLWQADMATRGFSRRTIDGYMRDALAYLKKDPMPSPLSIRTYVARRLSEVSAARVSSEVKALKSLFAFLYEQGLWATRPTNGIGSIRVAYRERECPTEEQIERLLKARFYRRTDAPRFRMLIVLLIDTGLRVTEAASLLRRDVKPDRLELRVVGKGGRERFVPLSPIVGAMLRTYLQTYAQNSSPYLFPGSNKTGYWDIRSIERALRRASGLTPHQLRHFYATSALRNGAKLEVISRILGHSNVGITASVYRHVQMDEMHQEHERFGPLNGMSKALPPAGQGTS